MDRWKGKLAVVTGASAGIGAAICKALVREGMTVVGLARREENIQKIAKELEQYPGKLHARKVDLKNEKEILAFFQWIKETFKGVHLMVNNAGLVGKAPLTSGDSDIWRNIYEVNVLALNICTREAVQSMFANNIDDGYIININSISGHRLLPMDGHAMYAASKHGVTILTDALRRELVNKKSHIKVEFQQNKCLFI
uniref:Dehydrogenase/reductase SDR family member 11 n=1 Tax=Cacopsylla melanoneura TaxID=428564 RepID=A0A8D8QFP6_9HEMI